MADPPSIATSSARSARALAIVLVILWPRLPTLSFTPSVGRQTQTTTNTRLATQHHLLRPLSVAPLFASDNNNDNGEPDLFEYFDPLLSPHAYPDGVSPDRKPVSTSNDEIQELQRQGRKSSSSSSSRSGSGSAAPFGINYYSSVPPETKSQSKTVTTTTATTTTNDTSDNVFEYFDPLLSPHSYPNGISPSGKPRALEVVDQTTTTGHSENLLSSSSSSSKGKKVGILLMDHGSRNEASNARLQAMANLYQLTLDSERNENNNGNTQVLVEAAHMEIAQPSIPEGLQKLLNAGVDEIVCHPYFLSPGRHVREDIPEIVGQAIQTLNIQIPVRTTAPVGSNTQLMLGLIHASVTSTSQVLNPSTTTDSE